MKSSESDAQKKHRHDIGEVDHGAESAEETTRSIQGLLGLCIVASLALTVWTLFQIVG